MRNFLLAAGVCLFFLWMINPDQVYESVDYIYKRSAQLIGLDACSKWQSVCRCVTTNEGKRNTITMPNCNEMVYQELLNGMRLR